MLSKRTRSCQIFPVYRIDNSWTFSKWGQTDTPFCLKAQWPIVTTDTYQHRNGPDSQQDFIKMPNNKINSAPCLFEHICGCTTLPNFIVSQSSMITASLIGKFYLQKLTFIDLSFDNCLISISLCVVTNI